MAITVIKCPHCGNINKDNTFTCECGEIITGAPRILYDESESKIIEGSEEYLATVKQEEYKKALKERVQEAKRTGNYEDLPSDVVSELTTNIVLTTSMFVAQHEIEQEIDIITAECAYGMNIFRDLFAGVRDVVGGRAQSVEKVLSDGRRTAMSELRKKAFLLGAEAVIAVDLDYTELSGGGKSGMLIVVATGTAVRLRPESLTNV